MKGLGHFSYFEKVAIFFPSPVPKRVVSWHKKGDVPKIIEWHSCLCAAWVRVCVCRFLEHVCDCVSVCVRLHRTLRLLWKVQQRLGRISSRPYGSHIFCKAAMNRLYVGAIEDDVALDVILARWSHLVSLVFLVGISSVKTINRRRYIFRSLSAHFPLHFPLVFTRIGQNSNKKKKNTLFILFLKFVQNAVKTRGKCRGK